MVSSSTMMHERMMVRSRLSLNPSISPRNRHHGSLVFLDLSVKDHGTTFMSFANLFKLMPYRSRSTHTSLSRAQHAHGVDLLDQRFE